MNDNKNNELKAGDRILMLDGYKELIVEGIWAPGSSHIIDFSAKYTTPMGRLEDGTPVFANQGFAFKDEGIKWKRIKGHEAENELQSLLRLMFDDIIDEQPSPFIVERVAAYCRECDEYADGIVLQSNVKENVLYVLKEGLQALEEK